MTMLSRRVLPSFLPTPPLTASMSFSRMLLYHLRCISVSPTNRLISFLGRSDFSTSALTRRSRKGRSTLCSCCTTWSWFSSPLPLNHDSKSSELLKTSGRRKLSSDHSSMRLFCSGVPVIRRRERELKARTICESIESTFLIRCASSITMYSHESFLSALFSRRHIS